MWLVGMYLLLHCEEGVFRRNVSGEDAQRFDALMAKQGATPGVGELGLGVDFGMLLMQPSLSLRAHLNGGWMDNTNFTIYILRHLRKFLLLSAVPHNAEAQMALESLIDHESPHDEEYTDRQNPSTSRSSGSPLIDLYGNMDANEMLRRHDEEHSDIGLRVLLTTGDIERLNFILQAPIGGLIDDPPMYISDLIPTEDEDVGGIALEYVEREIRDQLELELLNGNEDKFQQQLDEKSDVDATTNDMGKLDLNESDIEKDDKSKGKGRAEVSFTNYHKELKYSKVRGKTILMKPKATSRLQQPSVNEQKK